MKIRADIQGLRAVAVGLVLLNHLWPHRLTGGYIGVDVFFVISGFLITSHLRSRPPRAVGDFVAFWARRIRRLLPAASLVIVVTVLVGRVVLPLAEVRTLASDAIASSLYVANWHIAARETDYFDQGGAASALQHYWSLSVEEQFYLFWPLLIAAGLLVSRRRGPFVVIAGVGLASLAYSIHLTGIDQARAYFVTTTRVWELALGGLVAFAVTDAVRSAMVRRIVAWAGLAAIAGSAVLLTEKSAFPGWIALVPTLGAAAVIWAQADDVPGSPDRLWRVPIVQTVGNSSYAIYLWHWPAIVLGAAALGHPLTWPEKFVLVGAVLVVSVATTRWVEDPVRRHRVLISRTSLSYGLAVGLIVVSTGGAWAASTQADRQIQREADALQAEIEANARCAGAAAVRNDGCDVSADVTMTTDVAAEDRPDVYGDGCWNWRPFTSRVTCTFGDTKDPQKRIALIGNSHAGHWQPALDDVAREQGWQVTTYLVSECWTVEDLQVFDDPSLGETCRDWVRWAVDEVAEGDFDLVITSNRTMSDLVGVPSKDRDEAAAKAYASTFRTWTDRGLPVMVLRDTPMFPKAAPTCLQETDLDQEACSYPAGEVLRPDPMVMAAERDETGRVQVVDLTDRICIDGTCRSSVGTLITLFDASHMTRTFSRTLAPDMERAVEKVFASAG